MLIFSDDGPCLCLRLGAGLGWVITAGDCGPSRDVGPLKGMPQRAGRSILGKTTCSSSLALSLRTLATHLLRPVVTARSQHHGTAQDVPFCLAVCTEAKSGVVELKVDIHTEV